MCAEANANRDNPSEDDRVVVAGEYFVNLAIERGASMSGIGGGGGSCEGDVRDIVSTSIW
jgi:hypothetical protein